MVVECEVRKGGGDTDVTDITTTEPISRHHIAGLWISYHRTLVSDTDTAFAAKKPTLSVSLYRMHGHKGDIICTPHLGCR